MAVPSAKGYSFKIPWEHLGRKASRVSLNLMLGLLNDEERPQFALKYFCHSGDKLQYNAHVILLVSNQSAPAAKIPSDRSELAWVRLKSLGGGSAPRLRWAGGGGGARPGEPTCTAAGPAPPFLFGCLEHFLLQTHNAKGKRLQEPNPLRTGKLRPQKAVTGPG